ncbi:hypothetical protein L202_01661 [Cryptococcus amylolentus CBS 6039]|uniref:Uncharacterized protein n=1 Tax=Cryptococcus amylolentus CBS 6039 TaxID=1295533 RepID=A0A1E3I4M5_9TREE|nr:hypothetical protein L202_01661 [Cryptococcus amylolentus CBS 6039]ODN83539.1 hypothetical protein L202_01661 [Cryptococcus amylolentus CBS 6039]
MASTPPSPSPHPGEIRSLPRRAGYTYSHPSPSLTPVPRSNSLYLRYRISPDESSAMTDVESGIDRFESSSEDDSDYQSDAEGLLEVTTDDDLAEDGDDEESDVDCGLEAGPYLPTPTPSLDPQTLKLSAFAIIGRKRSRSADSSDESDQEDCRAGPDEKRRPIKHTRKSSYPPEKFANVVGSIEGLDQDFSSLRTSSLIMRAEVQTNPTQAFLDAAASISKAPIKTSSRLRARQQAYRKLHRRPRGRKFLRPGALEDPLVNLPALQAWDRDSWHFNGDTPDMAIDTVDRLYDSDASMRSISDSNSSSSDVEMLSASRIPVSNTAHVEQPATEELRSKVNPVARPRYKPAQPLSDQQVNGLRLEQLKSERGVQRLPQHQHFPVRTAGQHSTSRLRRTSPTSLLPVRRGFCGYARQLLEDPIVRSVDAFTSKAGRSVHPNLQFCAVLSGLSRMALFRAQRAARKFRIEAVKAQSGRINERIAERRQWLEALYRQNSVASTDASQDQATEEAAVEDLTERQPESPVAETSRKRARERSVTPSPEERQVRPRTEEDPEIMARRVASIQSDLRARAAEQRAREAQSRRAAEHAAEEREREMERIKEEERLLALRQVQEEADSRIARELSLALDDNLTDVSSEPSEGTQSVTGDELEELGELGERSRSSSPALSDVTVRSDPPEYEPPNAHPLGAFPSSANVASDAPFVRHLPYRPRPQTPPRAPARLPSYNQAWQARYTRASPPPPPPYNAQTDRETVVAARFEAEQESQEGTETYEFGGRRRFAPAAAEREEERAASPEPVYPIVGAFPSSAHRSQPIQLVAPIPRRPQVDSVVAFEAALDMEEGEVDLGLFGDDDEHEERGDVGTLQRLMRFVWGGRQ